MRVSGKSRLTPAAGDCPREGGVQRRGLRAGSSLQSAATVLALAVALPGVYKDNTQWVIRYINRRQCRDQPTWQDRTPLSYEQALLRTLILVQRCRGGQQIAHPERIPQSLQETNAVKVKQSRQ